MENDTKTRLQKYISDCGLMSRRRAEAEIAAGRITVNGERVEVGRKITPGTDKIMYNGIPVVKNKDDRTVCIMLNKPRGYVTTMSDEHGRKCVAELVSDVGCRVYPCGRLDLDSEGLLIMTNDGELANKLMHPKNHIPKVYHLKLACIITPEQLKALNSPMTIDGYELRPVIAEVITMKQNETVLSMTLFEGRNCQIRKMCEKLNLKVVFLKRIAVGNITLGNLKSGMWRKLTKAQTDYLRNY